MASIVIQLRQLNCFCLGFAVNPLIEAHKSIQNFENGWYCHSIETTELFLSCQNPLIKAQKLVQIFINECFAVNPLI